MQGRDEAGNTAIAGPINVHIDPASALPIVSIINPTRLQRVGGDLMAVGTCSAPEGVARVELRVDGGAYRTAQGGEFWSLAIPTRDIPEGRRILEVRGVGAGGLVGKPVKVAFDLDRTEPAASVRSPRPGAFVAGEARVLGSVSSANGIASLEISTDDGTTYRKVALSRTKRPGRLSFAFELDTRKFPDGPHILWLRSRDRVGLKGLSPFLVFVSNTKPKIEIRLPAPAAAVHGRFAVVGAVRSAIGVARLGYELPGGKPVDIPLTPGDPYFVQRFDARQIKGDRANIVLVARDRAGNVTRYQISARIDHQADKPVVKVLGPAPAGRASSGPAPSGGAPAAARTLGPGGLIWGSIAAEDGGAGIRVSVDGGKAVEYPAADVFSFGLPPGLASGRHLVSIQAKDGYGTWGDPVSLPVTVSGERPSVEFLTLGGERGGKGAQPPASYYPGAIFRVDGGSVLEGDIISPNALAGIAWSVSGGAARKLEIAKEGGGGRYLFRIPLDRSMPYGFVQIELRGEDVFGQSFSGKALLYSVNLASDREDTGFRFDDPRIASDGRVAILPGEPLLGAFYREELAGLRLDPPSDLVGLSFQGGTVRVEAVKSGVTPPERIVARTKAGHEFSSDPFVFLCGDFAPKIEIDGPAEGSWFDKAFTVSGRVSDASGLAGMKVELSAGGAGKTVPLSASGRFSLALGDPDLKPGPGILEVTATDAAGRVSSAYRSFGFAPDPPSLRFLSPEAGAEVSGSEDVAAAISDVAGIVSVEYAEDGKSFAPIDHRGQFFIHRADLAAHPDAAYRVTDRAGNVVVGRPEIRIVPRPDRSSLSASVEVEPAGDEPRVELSGLSGTRKVSLLLPALSEADYSALGSRAPAAGASAAGASAAGASAAGASAAGASAELPPRFAQRLLVSGQLALKGYLQAAFKLKSVGLSLDGGASYQSLFDAKDGKSQLEKVPLALSLDTTKLPEGEARWILKVEDGDGVSQYAPIFAMVANAKPTIAFLSSSGAAVGLPTPLVFSLRDALGLSSASLQAGQEKTSLPVRDGGSYYAVWADPGSSLKGGAKSGTLAVTLQASDPAGNEALAQARYDLDAASGLPGIELSLPPPLPPGTADKSSAPLLAADAAIRGTAAGPAPIAALSVSVDGGAPLEFAAGIFALPLSSLSPGRHDLVVEARTEAGRIVREKRAFVVAGPAPSFGSVGVAIGKETFAWRPGADLALAPGASLGGAISAPNGLVSVEYRIDGAAWLKAVVGKPRAVDTSFACALPAGLAYGPFVVELVARDAAGYETRRRYDFHNVLPPRSGAPATDDADAIRFFDDRISDIAGGVLLRLAPSESLVGAWNGRPIKSVELRPATSLLEASAEGGRITLKAAAAGVMMSPNFHIRAVTVDGDVFEWGPFGIVVGSGAPTLALRLPRDGSWVRGSLHLAGEAESLNGALSVEVSIDGGPFTALSRAAGAAPAGADAASGTFAFDTELPLDKVPDGALRVDLRVRDASGGETTVSRFIDKDTVAPAVTQICPAPGETVTGPTTVIGAASDAGLLASADFLPAADGAPQAAAGTKVFSSLLDLDHLPDPLPEGAGFRVSDRAGNTALFVPELHRDSERGKPVLRILTPAENEILRSDFAIAGTAFDYAGVAKVHYRIDGSDWKSVEPKDAGFSIPVALDSTTDNEHLVEAYAENIYGIKGDVVSRKYRISKEEPRAFMTSPDLATSVRGTIEISGTASDANGIESVSLSFDNGSSYVTASGAESWHYRLDTRILADGVHGVTIKPVDKYGTVGFSASLITVDNTPPRVRLATPLDGEILSGGVDLSGRVSDNYKLASVRAELVPVGQDKPPAFEVDLDRSEVVRDRLDVSSLPPGAYTLRLVARDGAGNETFASRDIVLRAQRPADKVELFYPVDGQAVSGALRLCGRATVAGGTSEVAILSDGAEVGSAKADARGYFSFDLPAGRLDVGSHKLSARCLAGDGASVESRAALVSWHSEGPWLAIDEPAFGSYLPMRPWLSGKAGWAAAAPDPKDAAAIAAFRKAAAGRRVEKVEVSLDNGRTYLKAAGRESWRFRLETPDYPDGEIFILVRATFGDGSAVVARTAFNLDKTAPVLRILSPAENTRFADHLRVSGTASDDESGLASVAVELRKGDKRGYELPAFVQGLYLDAHFFGATSWEAGLGLSFFGDNVKLQAAYGQAPTTDSAGNLQRFFGGVYSAKLIANVLYLPFSSVLGPDWGAFSSSLGLGAEFSYFDMNGTTEGKGLSAVLAQLEFPKYTLGSASFMKKYSLYLEEEAWFVSSDVPGASTILFMTTFGVRLGLF
ncbi:MAG: Ig-like domain-containing protein [Treponema sp.]|nr:Ig-like domain-containing protein [Treponema sp.]